MRTYTLISLLAASFSNTLTAPASRELYIPAVITPDASTEWVVGEEASVTWDASKVPSDADPLPWVNLFNTSSYGGALYVTTLATDFDAHFGVVSFTVPEVDPGSYFLMLAAWGQSSYHFATQSSI